MREAWAFRPTTDRPLGGHWRRARLGRLRQTRTLAHPRTSVAHAAGVVRGHRDATRCSPDAARCMVVARRACRPARWLGLSIRSPDGTNAAFNALEVAVFMIRALLPRSRRRPGLTDLHRLSGARHARMDCGRAGGRRRTTPRRRSIRSPFQREGRRVSIRWLRSVSIG
jgi:hypothetical protein